MAIQRVPWRLASDSMLLEAVVVSKVRTIHGFGTKLTTLLAGMCVYSFSTMPPGQGSCQTGYSFLCNECLSWLLKTVLPGSFAGSLKPYATEQYRMN